MLKSLLRLAPVGALYAIACSDESGSTSASSASAGGGTWATTVVATSTTLAGTGGQGGGYTTISGRNPILGTDKPDPSILRVVDAEGPLYYLSHTVHNAGDFPLYTSRDLVNWTQAPAGLFGKTHEPDQRFQLNGGYFCSLWAPQLMEVGSGNYLLSFTGQRYPNAGGCGPYLEDSGVFLASSTAVTGPFAPIEKPWEPFPAGANESACPAAIRDALPRSTAYVSEDCQGTFCHQIVRLDSDVFRDPADGRWWMSYAWYTNTPPQVAWEQTNHGEHVHLVELDGADPYAVKCDPATPQIHLANPHDPSLLADLAASCAGCDQMLSFTKGRQGEDVVRDGVSWGVVEGPSLFRRGDYVYALVSGSTWDSAYYHVFWIAAPTVEELVTDGPTRIVGRYLLPSMGQSFGHGSAVLGPDGKSWYFVHHRLDHAPCASQGLCARDVWVSPIEFEDRGDGKGDVYIKARRPAEQSGFEVVVPD